jgi:hypothetical protein
MTITEGSRLFSCQIHNLLAFDDSEGNQQILSHKYMMMWRRSGAGMHLLPYMIFIAQEII